MAADEIILGWKVVVVHGKQQIATFFERLQIAEDSSAVGVVGNQAVESEACPIHPAGQCRSRRFPGPSATSRAASAAALRRRLAVADDPDLHLVEVAVPVNIVVEVLQDRRMMNRGQNDVAALVRAHSREAQIGRAARRETSVSSARRHVAEILEECIDAAAFFAAHPTDGICSMR